MTTDATAEPVAPTAEPTDAAEPKTTSLDEHASLYGPQDPTLDAEAKAKNDEARARVRHRARSQQAAPEDAPRIAELTRRLRETEAERDALRQPAPASPARVAQAGPVAATPAAEAGAARQAVAPQPTRPEPSVDDIGTKYDTYEQFTRDLTKWDREQERAAEKAEQEQAQQARQQSESQESWNRAHATYAERLTAFKASHADFDALLEQHGAVPIPAAPIHAILASEHGPAWSYHLMQHPDQLAELALLFDGKPPSPEMVAHATRWLSSRAAVQPAATPAPVIALAPKPPTPVRTGAARADTDGPGDESMSIDAHEKAYGRARRR